MQRRTVKIVHRGTRAKSIVRVEGNRLTIPDFAGKLHFNTLGNLLNPRAALLFVDFETGDLLHLSGLTEFILNGPENDAFQGAGRSWMFHVERVVRRRVAQQFDDRHVGSHLHDQPRSVIFLQCDSAQGSQLLVLDL